jgi:LppX_LprAFG lipoprotein
MRGRGTLVGIALALAVTAAACGSGGGGGNAAVSIKTLQAAAANTQAASSYRFTMTMSISSKGQTGELHASGAQAADGSQLQATMDLDGLGSLETRLIDKTMYIDMANFPGASSKLPDGKHWVSISFDELKGKTGVDFQQLLEQSQQSSPTQGLQYLQGLSGDVTKVGDDTVNGEQAVHYRASIDYSKLGDKLQSAPDEVRNRLESVGPVPVDVWIDDQNQAVKVHFALDGAAMGLADAGSVDMTMEMSDFDAPLSVQAPPADETIDVVDLGAQSA